jgi:hypothetical protein
MERTEMADDMMDLLQSDIPQGESMIEDPYDEDELFGNEADWANGDGLQADFESEDVGAAEETWAFDEGEDDLTEEDLSGFLEYEDDFDETDEDTLDTVVAFALEADDEFLPQLAKKIWDNRKAIAGAVGKVARAVGPVASAIPLPQAQAIGAAAKLAGRVLPFEAESDAEALDIVAEMAKRNPPAVLPLVTGLAAKSLCGRRGPMMSMAARKGVAKDVRQAATALIKKHGSAGPPALAALAKRINAAARGKTASPTKKAAVTKRVAVKAAASSPSMAQSLANRTPRQAKLKAQQMMEQGRRMAPAGSRGMARNGSGRRGNGRRSITVTRPSRITITQL